MLNFFNFQILKLAIIFIRVSKISINFQYRNSFSISELISELCFYWKMPIFTWFWQNSVMLWYCKGSQKSLLINFSTKLTYFYFYFSKKFLSWKSVLGRLSKIPRFYLHLANLDAKKYRNWLILNFGIGIETQFRNSGIWYRNWKP